MTKRVHCRSWTCVAGILAFSSLANAASFVVRSDRDLIRRADAIVVGVVTDTYSRTDPRERIVTVASLSVSEVLKGAGIESTLEIIEPGGVVGNIGLGVSGSPNYRPGETVLLFLRRWDKNYRTLDMLLGKFNFATDRAARETLVRGVDEGFLAWEAGSLKPYVERGRDREKFLAYVRAIARGSEQAPDYFLEPLEKLRASGIRVMAHFPAGVYTVGTDSGSTPTRWKKFDLSETVTYTASGSPNAEQQAATSTALSMWSGHAGSNMDTATYGGVSSDPFDVFDGMNTIVFNVPGSDPNLGGTTVGYAQWLFLFPDGSNVKNGTDFGTIVEGDIKIETGLTGNVLIQVVAHEAGHTFGFRHSNFANPGEPSSTNAIMNSSATGLTSLQSWDRDAANHVYGDGLGDPPPCTPPAISDQPDSQTIVTGSSATLSVTATGTAPLSYQWFRGTSGVTTNPVGTNSSTFNTGTLTSTTSFWVRVTGQCAPTADSTTATITVVPPAPAQRTFVSAGSGNDANPCNRSLPCRQFAAAISVTSSGGEVVVLDSGGYGAVTISQSAGLVAPAGVHAAITAFSGNAITVAAGGSDVVILRGLYMTGLGGINGVHFQSGATLHVERCVASGFSTAGFSGAAPGSDVYVKDSIGRQNGTGFLFSSSSTITRASLASIRAEDNTTGVDAANNSRVTVTLGTAAGNGAGFASHLTGQINLESCTATFNTTGIHAFGTSTARVAETMITGNGTGVAKDGGATTLSFANNRLSGNTTNGSFSSTVGQQ